MPHRRSRENEVSGTEEVLNHHLGTDTFVVRGGKIVHQTFAAHITPRG